MGTAAGVAGLVLFTAWGFAQPGLSAASFEVTSVKLSKADGRRSPPIACSPGGTFTASGQSIAAVVRWAYDIKPYQLTGMPEWTRGKDGLYDVAGKAAGPATESQCRLMAQALLAERFQLAIHRETKPFTVYAMTIAKGGPKIHKADESAKENPVRINGVPGYGDGKGWTMAQLADFVSRGFPGAVLVDRTGLEGLYGIVMDFEIQTGVPPGDEMASAMERQLGLKLVERKEPMEVIVVDHLERPTEN